MLGSLFTSALSGFAVAVTVCEVGSFCAMGGSFLSSQTVSSQPILPDGNTPHRVAVAGAARDGNVRRRVVEIYSLAARDWQLAPQALGRAFRGARELRSAERRFVGEAVYGLIRWRRRLAFATGNPDATALPLYLAWMRTDFPEE